MLPEVDSVVQEGSSEIWEMVIEETVYLIIYLASVFESRLIFQAVQKRRKWNLLPAYWMPSPLTWCRPLTQQHLLEVGGETVSRTRAQRGMIFWMLWEAGRVGQGGRKLALFLRPYNYTLSHLPSKISLPSSTFYFLRVASLYLIGT